MIICNILNNDHYFLISLMTQDIYSRVALLERVVEKLYDRHEKLLAMKNEILQYKSRLLTFQTDTKNQIEQKKEQEKNIQYKKEKMQIQKIIPQEIEIPDSKIDEETQKEDELSDYNAEVPKLSSKFTQNKNTELENDIQTEVPSSQKLRENAKQFDKLVEVSLDEDLLSDVEEPPTKSDTDRQIPAPKKQIQAVTQSSDDDLFETATKSSDKPKIQPNKALTKNASDDDDILFSIDSPKNNDTKPAKQKTTTKAIVVSDSDDVQF